VAYVPEALARPYIAKGRLARLDSGACRCGYHLYYSWRPQPALAAVVEALRHRMS
jgi:DNA-binding transcriptional LysR family regulator